MEIVDPSLESSFFEDELLFSKAEELAESSMLECFSQEQFDDFYSQNVDADTFYIDVTSVHNEFYLQMMASFCIAKIMEDSKARSEFHIAGEMCRLSLALQITANDRGIDNLTPFQGINAFYNLTSGNKGFWTPEGTRTVCPTIDGKHILVDSIHSRWLAVVRHELGDYVKEGIFVRVEPPFLLNSGDIVAESDPVFYSHRTLTDFDEVDPLADLPSDLVLN